MPTKYYCDFCDVYLAHNSPRLRKDHNLGRKHRENVKNHYQNVINKGTQEMINKITNEYTKSGHVGVHPYLQMGYNQGMFPVGSGIPMLPGGPGVPMFPRVPGIPMPPGGPIFPTMPMFPIMPINPGLQMLPSVPMIPNVGSNGSIIPEGTVISNSMISRDTASNNLKPPKPQRRK